MPDKNSDAGSLEELIFKEIIAPLQESYTELKILSQSPELPAEKSSAYKDLLKYVNITLDSISINMRFFNSFFNRFYLPKGEMPQGEASYNADKSIKESAQELFVILLVNYNNHIISSIKEIIGAKHEYSQEKRNL